MHSGFEKKLKVITENAKEINTRTIELFIQSIIDFSQAKLVIDSSKDKQYLGKTKSIEAFNTKYVFIQRNVRGIIYSRKKDRVMRISEKRHPSPTLGKFHLLLSIKDFIEWKRYNRFILNFKKNNSKKSLFIAYEDFITEPANYIRQIENLTGFTINAEFPTLNEVVLQQGHAGISNRNRSIHGLVKIEEDLRWKKGLNNFEKGFLNIFGK